MLSSHRQVAHTDQAGASTSRPINGSRLGFASSFASGSTRLCSRDRGGSEEIDETTTTDDQNYINETSTNGIALKKPSAKSNDTTDSVTSSTPTRSKQKPLPLKAEPTMIEKGIAGVIQSPEFGRTTFQNVLPNESSRSSIPFGGAFARRKENSHASWFVDGKDMYVHAANMISLAKDEIFITDWWMSPEVHLKRPNLMANHWRLDKLLKRKAQEGVKIYVLLYKEVEMALKTLTSLSTKHHLQRLHPNIRVMRHPDHINNAVLLWSHHEKLIVVDQNIAFVGGLDMAYGRWDDSTHRLVDVGSITFSPNHKVNHTLTAPKTSALSELSKTLPGFALPNLNALSVNEESDSSEAEDLTQADEAAEAKAKTRTSKWAKMKTTVKVGMHRRPASDEDTGGAQFYDESDAESEHGEVHEAIDRARDLLHSKLDRVQNNLPFSERFREWRGNRKGRRGRKLSKAVDEHEHFKNGLDQLVTEWSSKIAETPLDGAKYWIGKDYINFIFKNFEDLDKPDEDFVDRCKTPRMPWHDVHAVIYGTAARDVAKHFIQRWNSTKNEKKSNDVGYPMLLQSFSRWKTPISLKQKSFPCNIQILRSISDWSLPGMAITEASIHQAYVYLIGLAKHFIYIENQFFVSMIGSEVVTNKICSALCQRIVKAHQNGEKFRVYVNIPLLPNFQGTLGEKSGASLTAVMRWTYASISRGENSLFHNLRKAGVPDPSRYIIFLGLRNWGSLDGQPVTELIYIHSKLMIVDDRYCIIGSANINDRSLIGSRDSEIAAYIEDQEFEPSVMNGQPYESGKLCGSFRRQIFREHLGLLPEQQQQQRKQQQQQNQSPKKKANGAANGAADANGNGSDSTALPIDVQDPLCDEFYFGLMKIASRNTKVFEKVFKCFPTDQARSFEALRTYQSTISMAQYAPKNAFQELIQSLPQEQHHSSIFNEYPTTESVETPLLQYASGREAKCCLLHPVEAFPLGYEKDERKRMLMQSVWIRRMNNRVMDKDHQGAENRTTGIYLPNVYNQSISNVPLPSNLHFLQPTTEQQ